MASVPTPTSPHQYSTCQTWTALPTAELEPKVANAASKPSRPQNAAHDLAVLQDFVMNCGGPVWNIDWSPPVRPSSANPGMCLLAVRFFCSTFCSQELGIPAWARGTRMFTRGWRGLRASVYTASPRGAPVIRQGSLGWDGAWEAVGVIWWFPTSQVILADVKPSFLCVLDTNSCLNVSNVCLISNLNPWRFDPLWA